MNTNTKEPRKHSLADLNSVELDASRKQMLARAGHYCGGPRPIQARKMAEAHDLLAMSQLAPRLKVLEIDLCYSLRAALHLRGPVPCRPNPAGPLVVEYDALLGLNYQHDSFRRPTPGWEFFQLLMPRHCWHANISADAAQVLCLGPRLPAGIRVRDLVLMAFGALSMQSVQVDEYDPAGVLNRDAAVWWQANLNRVPLCHEAFIRDVDRNGE